MIQKNINIIFTQRKISSFLSMNQKFQLPKEKTTNCVYTFRCKCDMTYTGETKLRLEQRIKSHIVSPLSAIHEHINACITFKEEFQKFGIQENINTSSLSSLQSFLIPNFKIRRRFTDQFSRKWYEGYVIKYEVPPLNRKDDYKFEIRI